MRSATSSSWGRRVADRYHATGSAERNAADDAERELKRAAKELIDELSRGVSALGDTFRDDQAKKDLTDAVSSIGDAITATVNEATGGDPLEGWLVHASSTTSAPAPAGGLIGWRSLTASTA